MSDNMSTAHIARSLSTMDEPFVRYKIRLNVSARPAREREIRILRDEIRESVLVRTLLAELDATGRIPLPPIHRWRGAHWVLYMLADLGSAPRDQSLQALRDQACEWLLDSNRPEPVCGAIEGNALYYLLFLELDNGRADALAQRLANSLPKALGRSPAAFGQALTALRGLALYARLRADRASGECCSRPPRRTLARPPSLSKARWKSIKRGLRLLALSLLRALRLPLCPQGHGRSRLSGRRALPRCARPAQVEATGRRRVPGRAQALPSRARRQGRRFARRLGPAQPQPAQPPRHLRRARGAPRRRRAVLSAAI